MRIKLAGLLMAAAAIGAGAFIASHLPVGPMDTLPECRTEDSLGCAWHAELHGNGLGQSFWVDESDVAHYVP